MIPLANAPREALARIRFVLTDMDDTLTFEGRLSARTYEALESLQAAGVFVMPVTAAPAGWADQMARMWPVDAVIAENGGVLIQRHGDTARRVFWSEAWRENQQGLLALAGRIREQVPGAELADDQPFRLTTLAFVTCDDAELCGRVLGAMAEAGLRTTRNNLWLLGWGDGFDKLAMARRALSQLCGLDIDAAGDEVLYVGDSLNDEPMFDFFQHTVGVSTIRLYLDQMSAAPAWITRGPGGEGFVEAAEAIIVARS